MADEIERISDLLSAPMEAVVIALGVSIARAQREMDRYAIETQREINEDPLLSEFGLQATWYQIPRAELELTMAIAMEDQPSGTQVASTSATALPRAQVLQPYRLQQLHIQPVNATYKNQFDFDVQASSKLKLTIVPVPPPAAEAAVTPLLDRERVIEIARPQLQLERDGSLPADVRLAVNFNGQARAWFVLEYRMVNDTSTRIALVVVDDDTGTIIKSSQTS